MIRLREARGSSYARAIARLLIALLVFGLVPLQASASVTSQGLAGQRELPELERPSSSAPEEVLVCVVAVVADPSWLTKDAFGELISRTGSDTQPYAFAAEPLDPNSGFQYHRARWMDPKMGRFLGMDPSVGIEDDPPSLHKYLYVAANPINVVDPTGLAGEGGLVGTLSVLSFSVAMAVLNNPVAMAAMGIVGSALLPEEVNNVMLMSGIPGLEALGEVGVAEARAIKLIKNAASERFAARELGSISNRAGHAFEEFAVRWLFPGAREEVAVGKRWVDLVWRDFLIELKTSRVLDARSREQLSEFAKAVKSGAAVGLRYVFLNKPTQATIRFIEEHGAQAFYLFE